MEGVPKVRIDGLYIEVTDRCNLRCDYCCRNCDTTNCNNMEILLLDKIINEAVKMGSKSISISGGEAFLHPQIKEIVHLVKKYKQGFTILTNGTLLPEIEDDFLHEIDNLQISLDGGDKETNDTMRGEGTFKRIQKGIETIICKGYKPSKISLKMVITSNNYREIKKLALMADKYGISNIGYSFVYREGRANEIDEEIFLNDDQKVKVIEIIHEIHEIFPKMSIASPGYTELCPLLKEEINLIPRIDVFGNVYACQMFDLEYSLGNLNRDRIGDIVHSSAFHSLRQLLIYRKDFMKKCNSCFVKGRCGRGCPGIALHGKDLFATDDMCCLRKKHMTDYLKHSLSH